MSIDELTNPGHSTSHWWILAHETGSDVPIRKYPMGQMGYPWRFMVRGGDATIYGVLG